MLPKSALQTIAACMVYDSDISKPAKMQTVRFIESASEKQLKHYILHGEIKHDSEIQLEVNFFIAAAILGAAAAAGRAIYDSEYSKAAKSCSIMEGDAKKKCMKRFKMRGVNGQISALRREMAKCSQTSRPDKCRKMFTNYIESANKKLKKIQAE